MTSRYSSGSIGTSVGTTDREKRRSRGVATHVAGSFKTAAFDRSATPPEQSRQGFARFGGRPAGCDLYRAATLECDNSGRLLLRRWSRRGSRKRGGQARGSGNSSARSGRTRVAPAGGLVRSEDRRSEQAEAQLGLRATSSCGIRAECRARSASRGTDPLRRPAHRSARR